MIERLAVQQAGLLRVLEPLLRRGRLVVGDQAVRITPVSTALW